MVVLHGSWDRTSKTGYKVVYFPWSTTGLPGEQEDLVTGWLDDASQNVWGRPVDAVVDATGNLAHFRRCCRRDLSPRLRTCGGVGGERVWLAGAGIDRVNFWHEPRHSNGKHGFDGLADIAWRAPVDGTG